MDRSIEERRLKLVIDGFLKGQSAQYKIIQSKINQYIYHQNFGADVDRDEIASEIMEILYTNLKDRKFKGDSLSALNVYIYSIIKHRIYRTIRRRSRFVYNDELLSQKVDTRISQSDHVSNRDLIDKINKDLDKNCRKLLKMKFLEQWSDQEIADNIKKTKNATSTSISRCLKKIQNMEIVKNMM